MKTKIQSMSVYEREALIEELQAANDADARAKFQDRSKELLAWFDGDISAAMSFVVKFLEAQKQNMATRDQEEMRKEAEIQKKKDEARELKIIEQRYSKPR
jgi:hypothetical protein